MRNLLNHHIVLLLILLGILKKEKDREVPLGNHCAITLPRARHVLLVIGVSLNMLIPQRLACQLNKHNRREMQGLLTALPLDRIFRRGGP